MSPATRPIRHALVLVVLTLLPLLTSGCSDGLNDGPLHVPSGGAVVGAQARAGQLVAYGFNVMTNKGTLPVTNISAELVPTDGTSADGITFEPAVVVDIGALDTGYLGAGQWPNEQWANHAKPLQGFTLTPAQDGQVELIVLAKVTKDGQWLWPTTRIEYDYDGSHYAEEVTNGFAVCAPAPCTPRTSTG